MNAPVKSETINLNLVNTEQAKELVIDCLKARLVPYLESSPGLGKSAIAAEIAEDFNLKFIDIRLSQCDPTDLKGFPMIDPVTGKGTYTPMDMWPLATDEIPDGYSGWLILLDEFPSASRAVQAAGYKVLLDHEVGQHPLHDKALIMAAGNKTTDGAIVNQLSTATQSRLVHFELTADLDSWMKWANATDPKTGKPNIDYRVRAFLNFKPNLLHKFDPKHTDKTFPCYRTWHFVSRAIYDWAEIPASKRPLLSGTISDGVAREFMTFCKIFQSIPTMDQILSRAKTLEIPQEPSVLYALTGSIGQHATEQTIETLMDFVNRLPMEFQVLTLRAIAANKPGVTKYPAVRQWLTTNAQDLF